MTAKILKLLPLVLAANIAVAETPAPAQPDATAATPAGTNPAPAGAIGRYELKKKSEFNLEIRGRAPFWPIGWTKQGALPVVAATKKLNIDEDLFKVTSIIVGNPSMAVINGRSYEEGQFIRMPKQVSAQLRPRLYRIGDGVIQIQVQNQLMTVQLKRPELNEAKHEPELLNEEKDDLLPVPSGTVKSASSR